MKKLLVVAFLAASLSACATHRPVIDTQGVAMNRYSADLRDCQGFAQQRDAAASTAAGAGMGAVFGALIGAAIGGRDGARLGAQVFAVEGAASGLASGAGAQIAIVNRCMAGRGYRVLG